MFSKTRKDSVFTSPKLEHTLRDTYWSAGWLRVERLEAGKETAFPWKNLHVCKWLLTIGKRLLSWAATMLSNTELFPIPKVTFCLRRIIGCYGNIFLMLILDLNLKSNHWWLFRISNCDCQNISVIKRYQRKCLEGIHPGTSISKAFKCKSKLPLRTKN